MRALASSGSGGLACGMDGEYRMEDVRQRMWDGGVVMEGGAEAHIGSDTAQIDQIGGDVTTAWEGVEVMV
jgi:hypothetical protein